MKADLKTLKKELKRLSDVGELKKELNRLTTEIRNYDYSTAIPSAQRTRLETRYRDVKSLVSDLQKRLDSNFAKITSLVRRAPSTTSAKSSAPRSTAKSASRSTAKSASNSTAKSSVKSASKSTTKKAASTSPATKATTKKAPRKAPASKKAQ